MNNIKKLLGSRIRDIRHSRKLSQEQLAELVNLDRRSISNIECGNTFPANSLLNIASALDTDLKNLFDFECYEKSESSIIQSITEKLPLLTKNQLFIIYKLIDAM